ncbi:MAG: hypothetical protein RL748_4528 [Pseudomonadota bacterium]
MRSLVFEGDTWERYEALREADKAMHKALRNLLKEMLRSDNPAIGTGKPEPLKHNLSGFWSRRISQKDRLIYRFDEHAIHIFAIGGHYIDK